MECFLYYSGKKICQIWHLSINDVGNTVYAWC